MRQAGLAGLVLAAAVVFPAGAGAALQDPPMTALALRYQEGDRVRLDLIGEGGLPGVMGEASVKRSKGRAEVEVELPPLPHPQERGPLYTTYVVWAVGPEGQPERLAELTHGRKVDVKATTSLSNFALVVTAEPHGLVTRPSPVLVARATLRAGESAVRGDAVDIDVDPADWYLDGLPGERMLADFKTPLLVLGARYAVRMARADGASRNADPELRDAEVKLEALEHLWPDRRKNSDEWESLARDVMRLSEHARAVAVKRRLEDERLAERRAAARNVADAESQARSALTEAERARQEAEEQRDAAQDALALAQAERQQAEQARLEAERARAEAEQARREGDSARSEAERARAEEEAARTAAARERAEREAMQQRLQASLAAILDTRREARGLIVSLSDVLFDTGKAALTAGAREKLSRVAGILAAYPGAYRVEIEGHTDSVGTEAYNQRLSESRARSVQAYLLGAGIGADRILAVRGLGESRPVADNINAAGRQRNRRVELVIDDTPR